jgi:hypothetical protein
MCSIESVKMGNSELWEMLPISLQKTWSFKLRFANWMKLRFVALGIFYL